MQRHRPTLSDLLGFIQEATGLGGITRQVMRGSGGKEGPGEMMESVGLAQGAQGCGGGLE
jgi:hypothetical protein